ncbi:hypothetical protein C7R95_10745 [Enterobacter hormaechei]|nr:hypothetical protein C7R95_10745 [Enterobacter hormaechei]
MLAIILSCNVSFRQSKVSVFKPQPRDYPYLLRFVSTKYPETKKITPFLWRLIHSLRNSTKNNHSHSHLDGFCRL